MGVIGPIRYAVSTAIMTASAPHYFLLWSGWRGISLVLPNWIYQAGDDFLYSLYQRMVVFYFEHCTRLKVYLSGDVEALQGSKENVLYLSNHQSHVDWIITNILAIRQGSIGHLRYVMKDTLQILPLYGFYFYQHGCVYVKRSNFKQRKMEQTLEHLCNKMINSWVVVFPEGTRFIPGKEDAIKKSQKAALSAGLKPLQYHLTPRYKGSYLVLEKLRNNLDAIYDITVVYSKTWDANKQRSKAAQLIDFLWGKCPEMLIHVRRIPIADVPTSEEDFKTWIYNLFLAKDEFLAQFYDEGSKDKRPTMASVGRLDSLPLKSTLPSALFFMTTFIPYFIYPKCVSVYWKTLVFGSLSGYLWLSVRCVC